MPNFSMADGMSACRSSNDGSSLASPRVSTKYPVHGSLSSTPASITDLRATIPLRIAGPRVDASP